MKFTGTQSYVATPDLMVAVNAAVALERPLLVKGEPGTGKTILAFEIASRAAFRELREKGAPKLLEPIMKVEVLTPDEYMGDVIGDLNSRRGQIQGTETKGNAQVVTAFVPLANMFGYINTLRSFSQGRASFTMQYDHYDPVPQVVADEVIKKYA